MIVRAFRYPGRLMRDRTRGGAFLTTYFYLQNRELQIMRLLSHPNVVDLKAFFYSNGDKASHTFILAQHDVTPQY